MADTGGAGRFRGGCGLRKDIELRNSAGTLSLLGDRHKFQPYGLFGGEPGARAETILNPERNAQPLPSKGLVQIERGDVVSFRLSGAGGYGPPAERDPAALAEDRRSGKFSEGYLRANYGERGEGGSGR